MKLLAKVGEAALYILAAAIMPDGPLWRKALAGGLIVATAAIATAWQVRATFEDDSCS